MEEIIEARGDSYNVDGMTVRWHVLSLVCDKCDGGRMETTFDINLADSRQLTEYLHTCNKCGETVILFNRIYPYLLGIHDVAETLTVETLRKFDNKTSCGWCDRKIGQYHKPYCPQDNTVFDAELKKAKIAVAFKKLYKAIDKSIALCEEIVLQIK